LTPEHLGELTLQVVFDNAGAVNAVFHTSNGETRSIIEASLPQLKQELQNQGLKVEYVGIYAGMNNFFSNEQRQGSRQPFTKSTTNRIRNISELADLPEVDYSESAVRSKSNGVDYRI
jgi:flagellar hook-length control protein FliK